MNQKETENITDKTLQSWDGMNQAEVSPFLWTRISSNLFAPAESKKWIAQPALRIYLAIWLALIIAHTAFWISGSPKSSDSTSTEVRHIFFSDDNPYSSY